jgi:hypothetical protein
MGLSGLHRRRGEADGADEGQDRRSGDSQARDVRGLVAYGVGRVREWARKGAQWEEAT